MKIRVKLLSLFCVNLLVVTPTFAEFPNESTLDELSSEQAFAIYGIEDSIGFASGASTVGDFNNDSFDDIIIAARTADFNGDNSGSLYVVFGRSSNFPEAFSVADLDGSNGFRIDGVSANDLTGFGYSSAGDVNNDGIADLLIGARSANPIGTLSSGAAYVIFGTENAMPAIFDLSDIDGNNGFRIVTQSNAARLGDNVSYLGDVNNDQIDDIIVGAPAYDGLGTNTGAVYIIFGRSTFPASLNVATLNGADGFKVTPSSPAGSLGVVSYAGDFNNDGIDDMLMGAPTASPSGDSGAGEAYVLFGRDTTGTASTFPAIIELSTLDGTIGVAFNGANPGDQLGRSLAYAGDINLDGIADVAVGAPSDDSNALRSGAVYIIYGRQSFSEAVIDLSTLDGGDGFVLLGESQFDEAGEVLAYGGDFNGDGVDDLAIGAPDADTTANNTGVAYLLYGWGLPFPESFDLDDISNANGIQITGNALFDNAGSAVGTAGDFNGDGISDLIIGATGYVMNDLRAAIFVVFGSELVVVDEIFEDAFQQE